MITSLTQVRGRISLRSDLEFLAFHCNLGTVQHVSLEAWRHAIGFSNTGEVPLGSSLSGDPRVGRHWTFSKAVQCVSQQRDAPEVPPHFGGATFKPSTEEVEVPIQLLGEDRPFQATVLESPA